MPVETIGQGELRQQLAQLAYDITNIRLYGSLDAITPFSKLPEEYKLAFAEGIWAASEIAKTKTAATDADKVTLKERDDGYLIYASCLRIKKLHKNLSTYSKFPEPIKEEYRSLAMKIYEKIECNDGLLNRGDTPCQQEESQA